MTDTILSLMPPQLLAMAYTTGRIRSQLGWLLAFDQRLRLILQRVHEPIIAQLRLSWWRDALNLPAEKRPKGEPLLAELGLWEAGGVLPCAAMSLVDSYEILITQDDMQQAKMARLKRTQTFVQSYDKWIDLSAHDKLLLENVAVWWADFTSPQPKLVPRLLRPMSILALAEHLEQSDNASGLFGKGLRLNWHALTGR